MKGKKILSILLVAIMTVTMFYGIDLTASATENPSEVTRIEGKAVSSMRTGEYEFVAADVSAPPIYTSAVQFPDYEIVNVPVGDGIWKIIPFVAKETGLMYFDFAAQGSGTSDSSTVCLTDYYEYDQAANQIRYNQLYTKTLYSGKTYEFEWGVPVNKGQTYYLLVSGRGYNQAELSVGACAYVFTTLNRTLYAGTNKWTYASGKNKSGNTSTTYFKVTPSMTGVMTVYLHEFGYSSTGGYVTLCNANKKAVSTKVYHNGGKIFFGVKKGYTYYLKVTGTTGSYDNAYVYGIKYGMYGRIDRAIGTKSNAKKLTRKANATHTLFAASTTTSTDWYKIYVSSKRATEISIDTSQISSGNLTFTVYRGTKKIGSDTIYPSENKNNYTITYGTTYGKANSGTYYIKVTKGAMANGKYAIRYVK